MEIKSLIIIFIILLVSCKSDKIIEINKKEYTLSYPSNLVLEDDLEGIEFMLFTEQTGLDDDFIENINLMVQNPQTSHLSLDEFVELSEEQIKDEGELISSERLEKADTEYQKIIYTLKMHNNDLKFLQHYYVFNNKAYILTFTGEEKEFENYIDEMEEIMSTFELR